jgi:hypothetical protein
VAIQLDTSTPARARLASELLRWGEPRPPAPPGLARRLLQRIDAALLPQLDAIRTVADERRGRRLLITKSGLSRLVCDGLALDPEPYAHTWANVRGVLAHAAIAHDVARPVEVAAAVVVDEVWHREASRRPGDPSSLSAWLNARGREDADALRRELVELVTAHREVWPRLPTDVLDVRVERSIEVPLARGSVHLRGVPDLVLASRREDDRARSLVIDLKTGVPRPERDREELRFYALLVTLATGRPPFRWASFHVTEGRWEVEDLREDTLEGAVARVIDGVEQQLRLAAGQATPTETQHLRGGSWCRFCLRREGCELSQAPATLGA